MMPFDGQAFGAEVVGIVKNYMDRQIAPVLARLDAMDATIKGIGDASSGGIVDLREALATGLKDIRAAIPVLPEPVVLPDVPAMIAEALKALPVPEPGKSVTVEELAPLVQETVEKAVAALPAPQKGKDGVGVAGALIDRSGSLIVTLTDGTTRDLGRVVGKDVDKTEVRESIEDVLKDWPRPKDGVDGLGFDDLTVEYDGERGFVFRMTRGEATKEFVVTIPVLLDRGVFKDGTYERGDGVTYAGSFWIAQGPTKGKPGEAGSENWRLAVKRGRDGKDKA